MQEFRCSNRLYKYKSTLPVYVHMVSILPMSNQVLYNKILFSKHKTRVSVGVTLKCINSPAQNSYQIKQTGSCPKITLDLSPYMLKRRVITKEDSILIIISYPTHLSHMTTT